MADEKLKAQEGSMVAQGHRAGKEHRQDLPQLQSPKWNATKYHCIPS